VRGALKTRNFLSSNQRDSRSAHQFYCHQVTHSTGDGELWAVKSPNVDIIVSVFISHLCHPLSRASFAVLSLVTPQRPSKSRSIIMDVPLLGFTAGACGRLKRPVHPGLIDEETIVSTKNRSAILNVFLKAINYIPTIETWVDTLKGDLVEDHQLELVSASRCATERGIIQCVARVRPG
jgi:hypothetical protein